MTVLSGEAGKSRYSMFRFILGYEADGALAGADSSSTSMQTVVSSTFRIGAYSHVGYIRSQIDKVNQDSHWELCNLAGDPKLHLVGVADGHGVNGHYVSRNIMCILPDLIAKQATLILSQPTETLKSIFSALQAEIIKSAFNVQFSGSTCVTVLLNQDKLICANVGDSRAVLGIKRGEGFDAVALSTDHKPDLPIEKARILAKNGRVQPFKTALGEAIGPNRVWLKTQEIPGLGMSRAIGDTVAATVGVISEPEVLVRTLDQDSKMLIVGSDGLWEFIKNEEAVAIASGFTDPVKAAEKLVSEAQRRWRKQEDIVDDTTAVVVYL